MHLEEQWLMDELRDDLADARAELRTWRTMAKLAIEQLAALTSQNARLRVCLANRHEVVYNDERAAA